MVCVWFEVEGFIEVVDEWLVGGGELGWWFEYEC